jgi:hypothetical protein
MLRQVALANRIANSTSPLLVAKHANSSVSAKSFDSWYAGSALQILISVLEPHPPLIRISVGVSQLATATSNAPGGMSMLFPTAYIALRVIPAPSAPSAPAGPGTILSCPAGPCGPGSPCRPCSPCAPTAQMISPAASVPTTTSPDGHVPLFSLANAGALIIRVMNKTNSVNLDFIRAKPLVRLKCFSMNKSKVLVFWYVENQNSSKINLSEFHRNLGIK